MRLMKARVTKYRSIRDTGWFEVEPEKTIFVGPNEAGKTVVLEALQQLHAPQGVRNFDVLRDYPRSEYNDITTARVDPKNVTVVEGHFSLEDDDKGAIPAEFREAIYVLGRRLDNEAWHRLDGVPNTIYGSIKKDLARLSAHVDPREASPAEGNPAPALPSVELAAMTQGWTDDVEIEGKHSTDLSSWLKRVYPLVDETKQVEEERHDRLVAALGLAQKRAEALGILSKRVPVFVLFSNYFRVRPLIHLDHLAQRLETNAYDDEAYDYGNKCLLQLLGFTARELSNLGKAPEPPRGNAEALKQYIATSSTVVPIN